MLNTRGHVSKAINYNCQCVFGGSTELGVIIYSVLYRAIKNSPNGVNCFLRTGSSARPSRRRGAGEEPPPAGRGAPEAVAVSWVSVEIAENEISRRETRTAAELGLVGAGVALLLYGVCRDICDTIQWRWQR